MKVIKANLSAGFAHIHVHVIVDDLEELSRLGNPPRLDLGPDRHVIQRYLKGACADQLKQKKTYLNTTHLKHIFDFYLSLDSIAEEEGHHAGVDLILEHPGGPGRGVHSQKGERVEGCEDAEDYNKL